MRSATLRMSVLALKLFTGAWPAAAQPERPTAQLRNGPIGAG